MAADDDAPESGMSDAPKQPGSRLGRLIRRRGGAKESERATATQSGGESSTDEPVVEAEVSDAKEYEASEPGADSDEMDAAGEGKTSEVASKDVPEAIGDDEGASRKRRRISRLKLSPLRAAVICGAVAVLGLVGLVGWLGFRDYQLHQEQDQRELFLRVGRQGAVNLTTIDYQTVNNDIQRILDSATGQFYDDFSKRSAPFIEVVKKVQSKTVGIVTEAGLESFSPNEARVLVAISVKTSNAGAPDQAPRAWRMRIDVQRVNDGAKVSNVLFVPS